MISLPETPDGGLSPICSRAFDEALEGASVVLVGPGMADREASLELACRLVERGPDRPVVLDAAALWALGRLSRAHDGLLVTPHAGELADLRGISKDQVLADPAQQPVEPLPNELLRPIEGAVTWLASSRGACWSHSSHHAGPRRLRIWRRAGRAGPGPACTKCADRRGGGLGGRHPRRVRGELGKTGRHGGLPGTRGGRRDPASSRHDLERRSLLTECG